MVLPAGRCFGDHAGSALRRSPTSKYRTRTFVGSATLVRRRIIRDNTDIDGVAGALGAAARHALVLAGGPHGGRGGLAELGVTDITVVGAQLGQGPGW